MHFYKKNIYKVFIVINVLLVTRRIYILKNYFSYLTRKININTKIWKS